VSDLLRGGLVDPRGGRQLGVAVLVVVPVEEHAAVIAGVVDVIEPVGELGPGISAS
jgi:hypothetical protein